jgi:predicted house-cleaning noncanonical NTP pyrophosphatase (MazG superfamily)
VRVTYGKLIRDRIPEIMDAAGVRYEVAVLDDAAFRSALRAKLLEEATEAASAGSAEELAKEIADLFEVAETLLAVEGVDAEAVGRSSGSGARRAAGSGGGWSSGGRKGDRGGPVRVAARPPAG